MRGNRFNIGLIAGVLITIGVMAVVGLSTLQANAALRLASPDVGASASLTSQMPKLGEVTFKGIVEQINADSYVVSGMTFRVDMQTLITPGLVLGDEVKVKALLLPDQTRYALSIEKIDKPGSVSEPKFEFYGIVESMGSPNWMISGEAVQVDTATMVDAGVAVGSLVEVEGRLVNGGLLASQIHLEDESNDDSSEKEMNKAEFKGVIESISGGVYVVDGKTVHTDASTEIKGMLAVGDMVKVEAFLQTDGSYLAHEIEKEDDFNGDDEFEMKDGKLEFTGAVDSINGNVWIIAGYTIMVGPGTEIEGNPQPGDQVKVEAFLQADGVTYLAHEIEFEDDDMHEDDSDSDDDRDNDHDDDEDEDDDRHDDDHDDQNDDHDDDDHDDNDEHED